MTSSGVREKTTSNPVIGADILATTYEHQRQQHDEVGNSKLDTVIGNDEITLLGWTAQMNVNWIARGQ